MSSGRGPVSPSGGPVVRSGHLRKLKTLKKKYFVLRGDAPGHPACLEYYDSKKKFDNRQAPKRSISMRSCFNINRRVDTKQPHVIALYTKDECFSLILESEKELDEWLNAMLLLSGNVPDGEQPRPTFEHVWQVTMQKKGLGERKNIHGPYRLCLTDRTLSLVKVGAKDNSDSIEFSLICIRRCGYMDRIFYMEVGRSAVTGGGDFWMEAEDNNIAHNMHAAILNAMSSSSSNNTSNSNSAAGGLNSGSITGTGGGSIAKDDVGPRQRVRSSSANEASKPISVLQRRHTGGQKLHGFSPLGATGRDRCDSLPSRARTTSEGHPTAVILGHPRSGHLAPYVPRPHSMYGRGLSYSPPVSSMPISPASGACSTDSAGSSLSMDDGADNILEEGTASTRYGHSLTPDEPVILEENLDDYAPWSGGHQPHKYSPNFKSHSPSQQSSYVEMYSPCGSSPGRGGSGSDAYMPMSAASGAVQQQQQQQQTQQQQQQQQQQQSQHNHSRASSLVEEMTLPDGYVPMAPVGDDGYVDMDPSNGSHNGHFPCDDLSQHGGSTCSVTSGTPSTDLRFSEYHLDKVTSYLAPGEEIPARPLRAYSVGSRPEPASRHRKNRLDIAQQEASRVRAFSVGSRSKRPEIVGRLASVITARLPVGSSDCSNSNKSNSAPLLSSSWGHNSGCSVASERMEDLMELDFTRPNVVQEALSSLPSSSYSQSHSQSYSTATDTSSYVDMSPGQPHGSTGITAPYVDMSGINKINRNNNSSSNSSSNNNNNNNNNTTTANHNHNHVQATTSVSSVGHKNVMKTLKPVEETEGAYMMMESSMDDCARAGSSPKQAPSPMQDDYMQMNGPPGVTRTAPVDLPQPRRPPEGYVEMSFKGRPSLEQDYINMSMGSGVSSGSGSANGNRNRTRRTRQGSRNDKSQRSQPIAIQASSKNTKTPSFLPLNGGSPMSESLASTPASPPRATPTGSNATIFPFSLNSPQSPIKPFTNATNAANDGNGKIYGPPTIASGDYATMAPGRTVATVSALGPSTSTGSGSIAVLDNSGVSCVGPTRDDSTKIHGKTVKPCQEVPQSPLTKRLAELTLTRTKASRNCSSPPIVLNITAKDESTSLTSSSGNVGDSGISNRTDKQPANNSDPVTFRALHQQPTEILQSPSSKRRGGEITFSKTKTSRGACNHLLAREDPATTTTTTTTATTTTTTSSISSSLSVAKTVGTSIGDSLPNSSTSGCNSLSQELPQSPLTKRLGDLSVVKAKLVQASPNTSPTPAAGFKINPGQKGLKISSEDGSTGTSTPIATPTPTATPSPLDSEGYEKLQPGATLLHYASLDLPEVVSAPPVSPTPVIEDLHYADIDFAKLKQN